MVIADEVAAVAARGRGLGDPSDWRAPTGYPDSLALCVIDSIWSIGIRYANVVAVVGRYSASRPAAESDDLADLLAAVEAAGGIDAWRSKVGTRHRTSSRGGIYKSDAVVAAAEALVAVGVDSAKDLRDADAATLARAEIVWCAVRGQRSGISWHYLLMLVGTEDVKPDRMILRFLTRAIGYQPDLDQARALVRAAAAELGVTARTLDHRIWRFESGRG